MVLSNRVVEGLLCIGCCRRMALSESSAIWKDILGLKPEERKELLQWQLQAREPIRRLSDMKPGDHLLMTRNRGTSLEYAHHFLCSGKDEMSGKPKIIHYYNTPRNFMKQKFPTSLGSGSCLEQLGMIQEMALPDGDLIAESYVDPETDLLRVEVERVVWPQKLRRYSTEEVITRAHKREGEKDYHPINNNCESFVMWCLCDLNISLQATPAWKAFCETFYATTRTLWQAIQQLPKVVAEIWDDVAVAGGSAVPKALSKVGISVGVISTAVVEALMAGYNIHKEYKKWEDGVLVSSREKFIEEVVDNVILALSRIGGSVGGMIVGQVLIPVPILGGLVGALVGVFGGHLFGKSFSELIKEDLGQTIDAVMDLLEKIKAELKAV